MRVSVKVPIQKTDNSYLVGLTTALGAVAVNFVHAPVVVVDADDPTP